MQKSFFSKIKQKKRKIIACTILVSFLLFCFVYYFAIIFPFIKRLSEETIRAEAVNTINKTNVTIQLANAFYGNIFDFVKDDNGEIVVIKSNTTLINQLNMLASTEMQDNLNQLRAKDIAIPAGAFTGSALLSKLGKDIKVRIISIGKCDTEFKSQFFSLGINHALHRLTINVKLTMDILVPWQCRETIEVMYEIMLGENVIVGKVPTTYLSGGENFESDYIDLIPGY